MMFQYMPFLLVISRWFVFWILETALSQFYDDKTGQRAREDAFVRSRNYVWKSAPGLLCGTRVHYFQSDIW